MIEKIISGGQSGADRAALDVAISLNLAHGGYCQKGRVAEDGIISPEYSLEESNHRKPLFRTRQNVLTSDATLVFCFSSDTAHQDGTGATIDFCKRHKKDFFVHTPSDSQADEKCIKWLSGIRPFVILNIAGPRSSIWGISYQYTHQHLTKILTAYFKQ